MKKSIYLICATIAMAYSATAQQVSPYVESATTIINNSGFKSTSIRTETLTRPTPMHLNNGSINLTFPTRFVVAKSDVLTSSTWAAANGWTSSANSVTSPGIVATVPTGCNAYFELNAPVGSWRLPTQREMILIGLVKLELSNQGQGFSALSGTYWTSTQFNASQAWAYTFSLSIMYARGKTEQYRVRCIRDL